MTTEKQQRYDQVLHKARTLADRDLDWVTFFREVVGIDGIVRKAFPSFEDLTEFEKSEQYAAIQRMLVKLREKKPSSDGETEQTRVITVRLPKSMHEYLRTEAHDLRTSMNKLCISKLLQVVDQAMIPAEKSAPSRRRSAPSPQPLEKPQTLGSNNGLAHNPSHGHTPSHMPNHTPSSNSAPSSPFTSTGPANPLKGSW